MNCLILGVIIFFIIILIFHSCKKRETMDVDVQVQNMGNSFNTLGSAVDTIILPVDEFLNVIKKLENVGNIFVNIDQLMLSGVIFVGEAIWSGIISEGEAISDFGISAYNLAQDGIVYGFDLAHSGLLEVDKLVDQLGIDPTYIFSEDLFSSDIFNTIAGLDPFKLCDMKLLDSHHLLATMDYDINLSDLGYINPYNLYLNGHLSLSDIGGIGVIIGNGIMDVGTCIMNGLISPAAAILNNYLSPIRGFNEFGDLISIGEWDDILSAGFVNPIVLVELFGSIGISPEKLFDDMGISSFKVIGNFTELGSYFQLDTLFSNPIDLGINFNITNITNIDFSPEILYNNVESGFISLAGDAGGVLSTGLNATGDFLSSGGGLW